MGYLMQPIEVIHSPFSEKSKTPIQPSRSDAAGQVAGFQQMEGVRV